MRYQSVWAMIAVTASCALVACGSGSDGSGTSTQSAGTARDGAAGAKGTLTVGYIDPVTGPLSFLSSRAAAQAAIDAANASGGVNGYRLEMKVYDDQSTPAAGVAALRRAINDDVFAVLGTDTAYDSGLNLLVKAGIPGFAPGASPAWFSNSTMLFPWEGNAFTASTTAWIKGCTDRGRSKVAIAVGTTPGAGSVADAKAQLVKMEGGTVVLKRLGVDSSIASQITSLARQIKDAGAQCVASSIYPGNPQLQVALNQIGADVWVIDAASYGPDVEKQFGSAADGLLYANYFAPLSDTSNPGVERYLADMKQYAPDANPICLCVMGYATAKFFMHALEQVDGEPTRAKVAQAANQTDGYDVDGLVVPIRFPQHHTDSALCLGYSQLQDGRWKAIRGDGAGGFVCGKQYDIPS